MYEYDSLVPFQLQYNFTMVVAGPNRNYSAIFGEK